MIATHRLNRGIPSGVWRGYYRGQLLLIWKVSIKANKLVRGWFHKRKTVCQFAKSHAPKTWYPQQGKTCIYYIDTLRRIPYSAKHPCPIHPHQLESSKSIDDSTYRKSSRRRKRISCLPEVKMMDVGVYKMLATRHESIGSSRLVPTIVDSTR